MEDLTVFQTYHGDHFECVEICCVPGTNILLQVNQTSKTNKQTHRKKDQICGYQKWGWWEGELDECSQKVQTSSYKINKYQACNVQHDKLTLLYVIVTS